MNFIRSIFSPGAASRPRLACEITSAGVVAAGRGNQETLFAFAPLRSGAVSAGLKEPNFNDRGAVTKAIRQALDEVSQRESKITLIIPDTAVRVLLLDFDSLPQRTADILPIIRFRLRKLVPFETEDAGVSYQVMPGRNGVVRTVVAVSPGPILAEYEGAVRDAGYEPGVVLPSTLAALAAVDPGEPSLVVNRNAHSVTTAIAKQHELLLHRTLELAEPAAFVGDEGRMPVGLEPSVEELQQSVSVAIAYFEDTLASPPRQLLSCGLGGAEELLSLLGDCAIPVRDLVSATVTGNVTSMPRGVLAGVRGALAT